MINALRSIKGTNGAFLLIAAYGFMAMAEPETSSTSALDEIVVFADPNDLLKVPGSGARLTQEYLDRFDHTDLHQLLSGVAGIYLRDEDGYGLRPNIGIRGATPDRSQKITIMEDGVLITPAPYSAPAAYYVPNVSRMEGIEIVKGPSAIRNGPHTVGGTINFVTEPVPSERAASLGLSVGNDGYHKLEGRYGDVIGDSGYLFDAMRYGSDGFKQLDGGGDTGFERNEVNFKWTLLDTKRRPQRLTFKIGYADEDADETYLGLSDADFAINPTRRYISSKLARFQTSQVALSLNYGSQLGESTRINSKLYYNMFEREWNKLNGFVRGNPVLRILSQPELNNREFGLLIGERNSEVGADRDTLDITNNDREFNSSGWQTTISHVLDFGMTRHNIHAGFRVHTDEVDRDHRQRGYLMTDGALIWDEVNRGSKVNNHQNSEALAIYVEDEVDWKDLTVTIGLRFEDIEGLRINNLNNETKTTNQDFLSPGFGMHWQINNQLGVLGGVYKGFSPVAPGSSGEPEESLNIEYGLRYRNDHVSLDLIGFKSDYENLLGRCRVSDFDCSPGDEFNGGNVEIEGLELMAESKWPIASNIDARVSVAYTYTDSAFQSQFLSRFSQWGLVNEGDELPYLPKHAAQVHLGLESGSWRVWSALKWRAEMREEPGNDKPDVGLFAEELTEIDLSGSWQFSPVLTGTLTVQNITDEAAIVSHRPLGARPNKPRSIIAKISYEL